MKKTLCDFCGKEIAMQGILGFEYVSRPEAATITYGQPNCYGRRHRASISVFIHGGNGEDICLACQQKIFDAAIHENKKLAKELLSLRIEGPRT